MRCESQVIRVLLEIVVVTSLYETPIALGIKCGNPTVRVSQAHLNALSVSVYGRCQRLCISSFGLFVFRARSSLLRRLIRYDVRPVQIFEPRQNTLSVPILREQ